GAFGGVVRECAGDDKRKVRVDRAAAQERGIVLNERRLEGERAGLDRAAAAGAVGICRVTKKGRAGDARVNDGIDRSAVPRSRRVVGKAGAGYERERAGNRPTRAHRGVRRKGRRKDVSAVDVHSGAIACLITVEGAAGDEYTAGRRDRSAGRFSG